MTKTNIYNIYMFKGSKIVCSIAKMQHSLNIDSTGNITENTVREKRIKIIIIVQ